MTTLETVPNELKLLQKFDPVKNILLTKKDNPKEDPQVLLPFFFSVLFGAIIWAMIMKGSANFIYLFIGTNGKMQGGAIFNITQVEKNI